MEITNRPTNTKYLILDNYNFESVTAFKYLVPSTISNNLNMEINNRLVEANKCYRGLKKPTKDALPQHPD
jgi:hypothetical protein